MTVSWKGTDTAKRRCWKRDQPQRKNTRRQQRQIQEMSHAILTTFSLVVWHKLLIIVRYLSWRGKKRKRKKLKERLPKHKECQVKSLRGDLFFFFFYLFFISWRLITLQYCSGFCTLKSGEIFLGWDQTYDYLPVSSYLKWYWQQNSRREIEAIINVNQKTHISEIKW